MHINRGSSDPFIATRKARFVIEGTGPHDEQSNFNIIREKGSAP
jgi:hypothetical protein